MRYKKRVYNNLDQTSEEPLINLTPLIDVVFVVLISFIVIAPMVQTEQIALSPAGPTSKNVVENKNDFKIYVKKDNSIWFENRNVSIFDLKKIADRNLTSKKKPVVFHDEKANFGTYQKIKNLLESTGFKEMEIVLAPCEK